MEVLRSLLLFFLAGVAEIGGGYAVWRWLRDGAPLLYGLLGFLALSLYGVIATGQPANFGRVYAAYGGVFIVMSLIWGWVVDGHTPDRWDLVGAVFAILGVVVMMYAPR